jgi:hypothetical protein
MAGRWPIAVSCPEAGFTMSFVFISTVDRVTFRG